MGEYTQTTQSGLGSHLKKKKKDTKLGEGVDLGEVERDMIKTRYMEFYKNIKIFSKQKLLNITFESSGFFL